MFSFVWMFIDSKSFGLSRWTSYWLIVLGSLIFSVPRYLEGWFFYVLVVFPFSMIAMLELIRRILPALAQIQKTTFTLLTKEDDQKHLQAWWHHLDRRVYLLWCLGVASCFAITSLIFNANLQWSPYTDALGIFYMGFLVGEISYLLILAPRGIAQLRNHELKLNPLDPANTVNLRDLAERAFALALVIGLSLVCLNVLLLFAGLFFRHLIWGVLLVSAVAWAAMIGLTVYPHIVFGQIVQTQRQRTLRTIENRLIELYAEIMQGSKPSFSVEDTLKFYNQVVHSQVFPISSSRLFTLATALLLNALPALVSFPR